MPEKSDPNDPWAPPESRPPQDRVPPQPYPTEPYPTQPPRPGVHDQPTMTSMPGGGPGGEVPPPPIAPGGPAQPTPGTYGYPAPTQPTGAYGYPGYPGYGTGYQTGYSSYGQGGWQQAPSNGMGITAMVLGIVSLVLFCLWGLGIIPGIMALIFGIIGRKKAQRGEADNSGMALAGIILGSVGIAVSAAFLSFLVWAVTNEDYRDTYEDDHNSDPYNTSLVVTTHR
ncbi:DUF4190 domain-containing protein [Streptomyces ficellus]|uniref:DUF4190 domain-containing protein n=1 Tax=Streptomyces ficellus TaxID=1977088 RepID=A0ABT7Z3Y6_9ACTN|nr:DUF4190 domain-containing protein [Streptomyces ficellus]MDN3294201.1 DUF4190 domain-containing protein [Streptomyces ficellus]